MSFSHLMDKLAANPVALAGASFVVTALLILPDGVRVF
jgi:hypothetical protein